MSEHNAISEGGWKSHDGVPDHSWRKPANWGFWLKVTYSTRQAATKTIKN